MVLAGLTPDGFALGLHAAFGAEDGHSAVQYAKGTLNFDRKVYVAGRINQIDAIPFPLAGGSGGGDGDTALLFLFHPVHGGRALMYFPQSVRPAGIEQNAFAGGGFARVDMGHDADIADLV